MDLRQYDPAIGRWSVMDPVTHHEFSPYSAFDNNPVYWSDPSGADADIFKLNGQLVGASFTGQDAIDAFNHLVDGSANDNLEVEVQNTYELSTLPNDENGGDGNRNGGGDPNTKRQKIQNAVDVTDQILKSNEAISAIEEYIANAVRRNSHKGILKIGKISGSLSKVTGIAVTGLEYLNGEISGLELTFDLGTAATSIWVSSEVGAALGGPYGFAAGAAVGVVAEYVIKPLYVNIVKPHIVVPAQKSYNSWWTGYYNQIIFNISNYY